MAHTVIPQANVKDFKWMNKPALRKARKKYNAWIQRLNTKSGEHYQDYIRTRNESIHESPVTSGVL